MRKTLVFAYGLAWLGLAGGAGATTVTVTPGPQDPQYFASEPAGANSFTLSGITWVLAAGSATTEKGTVSGQYVAPLGMGTDTTTGTTYMAVRGGGAETAIWATPQTDLTIYWGSIDAASTVSITVAGYTLTGANLEAAFGVAAGSSEVVMISGLPPFTQANFTAGSNPFDFTLGTGPVSDVPEPQTWTMLLAGLAGLCIIGVRRSRRSGQRRPAVGSRVVTGPAGP